MGRPTDDHLLLLAVRAGDEEALRALIARYRDRIATICWRSGLRASETEDAAAIVSLKLWLHAARIDHGSRVGAWIATTTRRAAADQRSLRIDSTASSALDRVAAVDEELERLLGRVDASRAAEAIRDAVTGRAAEIVAYKLAHPDATNDEVAGALGIPLGSVGPTLARIPAKLAAVRSPRA